AHGSAAHPAARDPPRPRRRRPRRRLRGDLARRRRGRPRGDVPADRLGALDPAPPRRADRDRAAVAPRPDLLVTATGALEVAGAVGLLVPATRVAAAVCLAALLLVMFPANVRAARGVTHPAAPRTPLLPRALMQVLFVAAAGFVALA